MQTISDTISQLHPGEAHTFEGLTVIPLFGESAPGADYLTLDEALSQKQARIIEVSEEGEVPTLLFDNLGERKVLLVDGDELVGAKQNRIINLTILVPAHTKMEIPVSCVEAGRWAHVSEEFSSPGRAMFSRARAAKSESVSKRMKRSGERASDQSEVWDNMSECIASFDIPSATESMSDIYESNEQRLGRYREAFTARDGQVGALFAIHGWIQGLELFDNDKTLGHYLARLVSSYALSSLADSAEDLRAGTLDVNRFLERVMTAQAERFTALGEGEDLRLSGEVLTGGALQAEERIVHLAAFDTRASTSGSHVRDDHGLFVH
jgi:hypothetical protein